MEDEITIEERIVKLKIANEKLYRLASRCQRRALVNNVEISALQAKIRKIKREASKVKKA